MIPTTPPTLPPPSPTPTTINLDVQKIREAVQQKVREKLSQITAETQDDQPRAFFGAIIETSPAQITIDYQGSLRHLQISADTVYIDAKRNKAKIDTLKIGQTILALGRPATNDTLDTKRLVATDSQAAKPQFQIVFGKVSDTSQTTPVFTLIPFNNKDQQFQIKTTTTTEFFNRQKEKIDTTLTKGHRLIAVIKSTTSATFTALTLIDLDYSLLPAEASAKAGTPTKKP